MGYKGSIKVVPNAVDTAHFSQKYPKEELDALKRKLGKKPDEKYIITTSRLVHKNAVDDVIVALSYLPKQVKFLILGIGPDETALKDLAKENGVSDRVMFLGQVDHKEMPKYLKISDVFTRPRVRKDLAFHSWRRWPPRSPLWQPKRGALPISYLTPIEIKTKNRLVLR